VATKPLQRFSFEKESLIISVIIVLILVGYYWHLASMRTIYETIELQKTNYSVNVISFYPNNVCDDYINLRYTVGNKTYSSPSAKCTYFEVNFERKTDEELDRMINSRNDGYFIGVAVENMGIMHRIKGVVYRNIAI
jgi:hypothetical protein